MVPVSPALRGRWPDTRARDAACRAFATMYTEDADKFPPEAREAAYLRRLEASYPVHPEVFERLYQDWSSLPKFQRTRGVLRLMARLVHSLWRENNRDLLILPGSIPLDDLSVRNELIKYLPAGWEPIVDKDIDGANASPRTLDDTTPTLGGMQACRRAARTIFLGSAHSVGGQSVRGIGIERVRLGSAQPGQAVGIRRRAPTARQWSPLPLRWQRPLLVRPAPEPAARDRRADEPVRERAPRDPGDRGAPPEAREGAAMLGRARVSGQEGHPRQDQSAPRGAAPSTRTSTGTSRARPCARPARSSPNAGDKPREFQNRLLFLAADVGALGTLRDQVRRVLAWQ